jgi:hypothetical protein
MVPKSASAALFAIAKKPFSSGCKMQMIRPNQGNKLLDIKKLSPGTRCFLVSTHLA